MSVIDSLVLKISAVWMKHSDDKRDRGLTEPEGLTCFRDIPYAPGYGDEHLLDIYTPAAEGESLPVLISVHGGGYVYGDKERYRFYCMELALQGYTVVNFNYRLVPARFPAGMEDLNSVMLFIRGHAGEYRMDADRIFAVGDSAGGQILSLYAVFQTNPEYAARFSFAAPEGLRFSAVGLHSGLYDCGQEIPDLSRRVRNARTKGVADAAELMRIDRWLTPGFPPSFITRSVNDELTQDAPLLAALLDKNGVPYELCSYGEGDKGISHVFHLNIRLPEARECNARQDAFFREHMKEETGEE